MNGGKLASLVDEIRGDRWISGLPALRLAK
jgi:hypothetical protein